MEKSPQTEVDQVQRLLQALGAAAEVDIPTNEDDAAALLVFLNSLPASSSLKHPTVAPESPDHFDA